MFSTSGTPHSLVLIMHQLLSPIFHLKINFLTVFGLTSFSGEGFPFGLSVFMETLKTCALVPILVDIFLSFLIRNHE
jgi:hypothetical protein